MKDCKTCIHARVCKHKEKVEQELVDVQTALANFKDQLSKSISFPVSVAISYDMTVHVDCGEYEGITIKDLLDDSQKNQALI